MLKAFYNMIRGEATDTLPPHWGTIDPAAAEALEKAASLMVTNASTPLGEQIKQLSEGFNQRQKFLTELFSALELDPDGPTSVQDVIAAAKAAEITVPPAAMVN